ncbi:unnamed protein product, partial [Choristocarpus tenellus]
GSQGTTDHRTYPGMRGSSQKIGKHAVSYKYQGLCYSCGRKGHRQAECPYKKGGPPKMVGNAYHQRANPQDAAEELAGSELPARPRRKFETGLGGPARTGRKFKTMLVAMTNNGEVSLDAFETWCFDSGASNSVTNDSTNMYNFTTCSQS